MSSKDLTLNKVEGGYHEMLMGDERIGSADGILAWMKERAGKARSQEATEEATSAGPEHVSSKL